jgi:ubiquinone/menaquinone biosynthesis C-methylase UbiE
MGLPGAVSGSQHHAHHMMERILEPEYMDTEVEARSYAAMDHTEANRSVAERLLALGGGRGLTLDMGTGPGDIPILLAGQRPGGRYVAVDAAWEMLKLAKVKIADRSLAERIVLHQADAKRLPYPDHSFDAVFSNTILHHIPEPIDLLREAWRVLRPGGVLLIRDLYRPPTEADAWALVDRHAAGATDSQRRLLFDSLHAALTLEEARELVAAADMAGTTVEMTSDRHYTIECR